VSYVLPNPPLDPFLNDFFIVLQFRPSVRHLSPFVMTATPARPPACQRLPGCRHLYSFTEEVLRLVLPGDETLWTSEHTQHLFAVLSDGGAMMSPCVLPRPLVSLVHGYATEIVREFRPNEQLARFYLPESEQLNVEHAMCVSADGRYVATVHKYGLMGQIWDTVAQSQRCRFARDAHHREESPWSIAFFTCGGRTKFLCARTWNTLDVHDVETWTLEKSIDMGDFFTGTLYASPSGRHLVNSGWVWGSVGAQFVIDTDTFALSAMEHDQVHVELPVCWFTLVGDHAEEGDEKDKVYQCFATLAHGPEETEEGDEPEGDCVVCLYDVEEPTTVWKSVCVDERFPRPKHLAWCADTQLLILCRTDQLYTRDASAPGGGVRSQRHTFIAWDVRSEAFGANVHFGHIVPTDGGPVVWHASTGTFRLLGMTREQLLAGTSK
jgi:hypothetical protein